MAVTSIWYIKNRLDAVIRYIENPEKVTEKYYTEQAALHVIDGAVQYAADDTKTERREFVTCLNCDEKTAAKEFLAVKRLWERRTDASATMVIRASSQERSMQR